MLHLGYYYHIPPAFNKGYEFILGFNNDHFEFYLLKKDLAPRKYLNFNGRYYDLSMPVIFSEKNGMVSSVQLVSDIPILDWIDDKTLLYILSGETNEFPYLYSFAKNVIKEWPYSELEKEFIKTYFENVYLQRRIERINIENAENEDKQKRDHYNNIITGIEFVLNFDIIELLKHLYINVYAVHIPKIGGDDRYYVYKVIEIKDYEGEIDEYLKFLINIGEHCIVSESGYTSYFPHPEITFGVYQGEILEKEKSKILAKYSKAKHIYFKTLSPKPQIHKENPSKWIKRSEEISKFRKEKFSGITFYSKIRDLDRMFRDNPNVETALTRLNRLNRYALRLQGFKRNKTVKIAFTGRVPLYRYDNYRVLLIKLIDSLYNDNEIEFLSGDYDGIQTIANNLAIEYFIEWKRILNKDVMGDNLSTLMKSNDIQFDILVVAGDENQYLTEYLIQFSMSKNIQILRLNI